MDLKYQKNQFRNRYSPEGRNPPILLGCGRGLAVIREDER
jgi:hypothetical protein